MKLGDKIICILLIILSLSFALDLFIQHRVITPSYIALEENEARKDMQRCIEEFQREIHHLNNLTLDWADGMIPSGLSRIGAAAISSPI